MTGNPFKGRAFTVVASILVAAVVLLYTAALWALMKFDIPPNNRDAAMLLVGGIPPMMMVVIQFCFGSSIGSKSKDEAVAGLLAAPPPALPLPLLNGDPLDLDEAGGPALGGQVG